MSAGAFVTAIYERDNGDAHPIKIQPETNSLTLAEQANVTDAGPLTSDISAVVSRGKRSLGLNARTVSFRFTGTPPVGYKEDSVLTLPWLDATSFQLLGRGAIGTYNPGGGAVAVEYVGKSPEKAN